MSGKKQGLYVIHGTYCTVSTYLRSVRKCCFSVFFAQNRNLLKHTFIIEYPLLLDVIHSTAD